MPLAVGDVCPKGHTIETEKDFTVYIGSNGHNRYLCRLCNNERMRDYRAKNPEWQKNRTVLNHGITLDEYDAMLEAQDGRCKVCRTLPDEAGRSLSIDHDHTHCPGKRGCRECVRGLLCGSCNRMLGSARDNALVLMAAIRYLEDWESRPQQ